MKSIYRSSAAAFTALVLSLAGNSATRAQIITNGGFEAGLTGWTTANQAGSDGTFVVQSGTTSPVNGFPVPAPPQGTQSAMTDSGAGGSHILYQNFVVPVNVTAATISFSLFINSGDTFVTKSNLNWAETNQAGGTNLNQQVRVDLLRGNTVDPFSVAVGDVLQALYQSNPGDPLVSGYTNFQTNITALFQANAGQALRLRFAEVDNVSFLNLGVDNVSVSATTASAAPEPSSLLLAGSVSVLAMLSVRRRRR